METQKKILWIIPEQSGGIRFTSERLLPYVRRLTEDVERIRILEPLRVPYEQASQIRASLSYLKETKPDLIHVHHEIALPHAWPPLFESSRHWIERIRSELPHTKIVATGHTVSGARRGPAGALKQLIRRPIHNVLSRADEIRSQKSRFESTWGGLDALVVQNFWQRDAFRQFRTLADPYIIESPVFPVPSLELNQKPSIHPTIEKIDQEDEKLVVVFGFFSRDQGQDIAIKSMKNIASENIRLILAGGARRSTDHEYLDECLELARKLDVRQQVTITGFLQERYLYGIYERADLILAPSRLSVGSFPLSEPLSRNCAILASDLPIHRELDQREPGCISLFHTEDPNDCALHMEELIADSVARSKLKAHAGRFAKSYSPKNIARKYLDFYRDLL